MKPWQKSFRLQPSLTMFFLLFCFPRMTLNISYLSHTEQLSLDTFEYIDCGNNSTIPHPMGWWHPRRKKKTPDWKCEEINILPRFQPRLFRAGCENASRLILYVVLAYLKTLINHYNVLNLKYWCFKCIYVFARMFFLLLLFVRDPTGQVFYMKTFL